MSDTPPITVNPSPAGEQLKSAVRTFLVALGGYIAGRGWLPADLVGALVPLVMILGPALWAQVSVVAAKRRLVTVAKAAPDSVATVKS